MMSANVVLAAALLPERPGTFECLQYQVVGLIVVLAALAMLWLICELGGVAFRSARVREVRSLGGGEVFDDEGDEPAIRAAIMAAVHATLGPGHRIVSAAPIQCGGAVEAAVVAAVHATLGQGHRVVSVQMRHDLAGSAWSAEGRRQHFQSHKVR